MIAVLIFLVTLFYGIYILVQNYNSRIARLGAFIPGPKRIPIIGFYGTPTKGRDYLKFFKKMIETYGPVFKVWFGNNLCISLFDPKDIEVVINNQNALGKGMSYDYLKNWLGTGLLTSSGQKWHKRRKALTPAFHFQILETFIEVFNRKGRTLLKLLEAKATRDMFDIQPVISNYTLDVICEAAMGIDLNIQESTGTQYLTAIKGIVHIITSVKHQHWIINILTRAKRKRDMLIKILHDFTNKVIGTKIMERKKIVYSDSPADTVSDKNQKTAFLELLLNIAEQPDSSVTTHEDIREEVDTFMFEGHDTTASALSSTIFLLGKHQDVQNKVLEEILRYIPHEQYNLMYSDLQEMKYLEMVIKEALRLYPPVPSVSRHLTKDILLPSGYILPANAFVSLNIYYLHRNSKYFPNPEQFNPDNFLPENIKARHSHAFIPFSAGPRNCIGQKFAMLEMKSTLCKLLYKYKVESEGFEIKPCGSIIFGSENGFPIKLSLRKK